MNTFWEYSIHTEAQRLLQICQKIACGFYKINNFIVLPYPAKANPNTVILPILPYLSISRYWDRLKKMPNESIPITPPKYLLPQTKNLLATGDFPHPPASIRHLWSKYQKTIMKTIYQTLPQKQNFVKSLHLWQTNFGTICSFSWEKKSLRYLYLASQ